MTSSQQAELKTEVQVAFTPQEVEFLHSFISENMVFKNARVLLGKIEKGISEFNQFNHALKKKLEDSTPVTQPEAETKTEEIKEAEATEQEA